MKILQLTVHFSPNVGGVETHLDDLVNELVKHENDVFVLTYRPISSKISWKIIEKTKNKFVFRIPWFPGLFYTLVENPVLEFLYLSLGLFIVMPFVLVFYNPKVIHAHGLIAGFVGVIWSKIFRKRLVISTHNLYNFPNKGLYRKTAKFVFGNADKVICLSNQSVEEIVTLGINRNHVGRFVYWADLNKFKPLNKKESKQMLGWNDKVTVFFVGRLVDVKGVNELLEAAKLVGSKVRFAIAGDGPLSQKVKNFSTNKNLDIEYLGRINNDNLPLYFNAADLLIVPSIHDEGFGRVIIEALACGTPVVGSNRGAIPEAMNSKVGMLVDITPANISNAVMRMTDTKLRHGYAKEAEEFAKKNYSSKNLNQILDSYK